MPRQAIKQATCEKCDDEEASFTVTDTTINLEEAEIEHDVRCTCKTTGTIIIGEDGVSASDGINHDDASWNQEDEDE